MIQEGIADSNILRVLAVAVKIAETLNIDSLKNYNLVVTVTRSLRVGGVIKKNNLF